MTKFIQNLLAASLTLTFAVTAAAQYSNPYGGSRGTRSAPPASSPSGGYYTGSSAYGSSVTYGYSNEIITNFTYGNMTSGKDVKGGESVTRIHIGGTYLRTITSDIQAGGQLAFDSQSGNNSHSNFTLVGLGVYNFDTNLKEAFFVQGGLGIYPVLNTSGDYESKFGFMVGGGKRFPIWDRINYIPTVSVLKKGDLDMSFDIQFLNFSVMF